MQNYQIGVDVGGTKTRVGLVDSQFHLVSLPHSQKEMWLTYREVRTMATLAHGFIVFPTPTLQRYPSYSVEKLQKMLVAYITQAVKALQIDVPSVEITSGAVAFAGLVKDNAIITKAADLYFSWGKWDEMGSSSDKQLREEFFLKEQLEKKKPKMTWFIVNDVIAATCRYTHLPQYQQVQTLALVTVSTGIGYALFNREANAFGDNDLVSLGHTLVDTSSEALDCDCGGKGHLAAYFSGKAIEGRVRARASQELYRFVDSSLCHLLRERFANMSSEERKERLHSAAVMTLIQKNTTLTNSDITAFLQKKSLSASELHTNTKEAFLLAMMVTNSEITQAINSKDTFVMDCLNEMMEKFSLGFRDILRQRPEKIVIMGGFVLRIKFMFLDLLITHLCKGPERQETQAYLQKSIEWAYEDDLDGVIGAICARDDRLQGQVTRSIDPYGSTVFEVQACTEKRTSYIRTSNVFAPQNVTLLNALTRRNKVNPKVMVVINENISSEVEQQIMHYFEANLIPVHLHKITSTVDTLSMKDVEALLLSAKTFKVGRKDYFLTVGCRTTLHCGGLAAAIYRRGISHIFIPLDDNPEDLATSRNTVKMHTWEKRGLVSNYHPPDYVVLDETLVPHFCQIPSEIKTIQQADHYAVVFVNNLFGPQNTRLSSYVSGNNTFVVISEAADVIFGEKIKHYLKVNNIQYRYHVYSGGENKKYFTQVLEIVQQILMGQDANEILISIGGGVTMDLTGFAAALTERQYIRIPTTLLGTIDAGIGVKVGCNYQGSKNFLGDFYAPLVCLNDRAFLKTVSPRDMRAGLAEILKMGIVRETKIIKIIEEYYDRLIPERFQTGRYASNLLELATYWMLKELQTNLHEDRTLKRLVDFGHAFSPFLEMQSNHRILHGEAVAIDMALCTELSYIRGYCTRETRERILNVLVAVGLPIFDEVCQTEGLWQSLKDVSLARDGLHLPIPERIGKMIFIEQVAYKDLKQAVTYLQTLHEKKKRNKLLLPMTGQAYDIMYQGLLV